MKVGCDGEGRRSEMMKGEGGRGSWLRRDKRAFGCVGLAASARVASPLRGGPDGDSPRSGAIAGQRNVLIREFDIISGEGG